MKSETYNIRGTQMNKMPFSEIEGYLQDKGIDTNAAFDLMADDREYVYVSNGFVRGLLASETALHEWHHYFKKDTDGNFVSGKLNF